MASMYFYRMISKHAPWQHKARLISGTLLFITAISALIAGFMFMSDPSGESLGMSPNLLRHSPFTDFFVPGLVLFVANGLFNLFALVLLIGKVRHYPVVLFFQGCVLMGWIGVQIIFLQQVNFLHVVMNMIGLTLMISGVLLSDRLSERSF